MFAGPWREGREGEIEIEIETEIVIDIDLGVRQGFPT